MRGTFVALSTAIDAAMAPTSWRKISRLGLASSNLEWATRGAIYEAAKSGPNGAVAVFAMPAPACS